ncbi:hypothetical protein ASC97_11255 [Rhizobium sp. Root1203]|jgi:hypothetical protein|uniref:DUF982 domain-containing protein n=1 Tax=Rhizobium sp. Root1203 TaxID=1736427 RepID=UPI000710CD72|nr:hypothetical protein ASC97_11255 [Rhizobium sp. Root1203]
MHTKKWSRPISYASPQTGEFKTIGSANEAIAVLREKWPVAKGRHLQDAQKICLEVLEGKRPPAEARRAFIAAAVEANLFVKEK